MESILSFGVLIVLLSVAFTSKLDYTEKTVKKLPLYKSAISYLPTRGKKTRFELIDPEATVRLVRIYNDQQGIFFEVDDKEDRKIDRQCHGRPGIMITMKDKMFQGPQLFCFSTLVIQIERVGKSTERLCMKILMEFTLKGNKSVHVSVSVYSMKPPQTKLDEKHAQKNEVLRVDSPIPQTEFEGSSLKTREIIEYRYGGPIELNQEYFKGGISWAKEVLKRAKFSSQHQTRIGHFNERYIAGPVIMEKEVIDKIISLNSAYKQYASYEGTK